MKSTKYDVVVIGGGAAGLVSAISIAHHHPNLSVLIVEKMEKCGRKIRITGKGRCNLTNNKSQDLFLEKVRSGKEFFEPAFKEFDNLDTCNFFEDSGLPLSILQGGRIFPKSEDAWDVVRCLEGRCKSEGVEIEVNCEVGKIEKIDNGFKIEAKTSRGSVVINTTKVVIATGGKSYPKCGSTGDGYTFAKSLGHKVTKLTPSLVPFNIDNRYLKELKGLVVKNIAIQLVVDNKSVAKEGGDIEFFGFGVGGGTIFRMSREAVIALRDKKRVEFLVDFKPALGENKLLGRFSREVEANSRLTLYQLLRKMFPQKMLGFISSEIKIDKNSLVASLSKDKQLEIIKVIKLCRFKVLSDRGFNEAVVTAGGVECGEIDKNTYQSKLCKGLYFAGEVIDIDADTGGYNLQIAFTTGYVLGKNINSVREN